MSDIHIPGAPQGADDPQSDKRGAGEVSPTGAPMSEARQGRTQQGEHLTTAQGARLRDTDHSLKAGVRGPTLLQDHHLREKITHFDHERIPERVVHARGAAAHGIFESYGTAGSITAAPFLAEKRTTEVFTRFSTVLGSRGSADTVRDTRGFATKFYTPEGTFDLVANNIPVFFIQDGIKFPDVVHAAKPHPDREIPQAQSAHDTFWDFVSQHTEAQHHTMWNMSDRGIPRSYRMMEGFGVHTFRMIDGQGKTSLVKFHLKPRLGVHSLVWEEAQLTNGFDPDFHRRDLADAIEAGAHPEWELGVQVFPDAEDQMFEGIDLLDPTKVVPEELAPVQPLGRLTLNANPRNYFAETEQVAFHPGHLVPGIDVTNDPLLQARLFSYIDTQITRLGGPNFAQIPINRPHAPVNDMLRDGFHQSADHVGVAPYRPNTLDGDQPHPAVDDDDNNNNDDNNSDGDGVAAALIDVPEQLPGAQKLRQSPQSFADHFSQVTMFYRSMTAVEREHIIAAYTFELGKCYDESIRQRQLERLARIDADLAQGVADGLGLEVPEPAEPPAQDVTVSPALSQAQGSWPLDGRIVGIVIDDSSEVETVQSLRRAVADQNMVPLLVAPTGAPLSDGTSVQRTYQTARSVEFDAIIFLAQQAPRVLHTMADEAYRHAKALLVGPGSEIAELLPQDAAGVLGGQGSALEDATVDDGIVGEFFELMRGHRVWERTL